MQFIEHATAQKLRGGYYTPNDLAKYICQFVLGDGAKDILEPSSGDGSFLEAIDAVASTSDLNVTAFELDQTEAEKSWAVGNAANNFQAEVFSRDFLGWSLKQLQIKSTKFDGVVGNPPFIRYQYLPAEFQDISAEIFNHFDLKFTKHTNAWVPFVIACIGLLKPGGRLGLVLPAEIIHVLHAQSLRSFLGEQCRKLMIIDPQDLWFEGTLQGAVILFAEKKKNPSVFSEGLGVKYVQGRDFLKKNPKLSFDQVETINGKTVEGKWTKAFLTESERSVLDGLIPRCGIKKFSEIADVDVGIVTGANKFFLVDDETVDRFDLHQWAHPMFGRSEHCPGILYNKKQHQSNSKSGKPTNFIWFGPNDPPPTGKALDYIKLGEDQDLHSRYKCRIRKPWYRVPSVYSCEIGMLKRANNFPRLIRNKISAYTTDTAYRIRSKHYSADQLVYSFLNPLTALSAELEGRHYGGGVLELVPSEIEKLWFPIVEQNHLGLSKLDKLIRQNSMKKILEVQAENVLGKLGISGKEQAIIFAAWNRLRARRQRKTITL